MWFSNWGSASASISRVSRGAGAWARQYNGVSHDFCEVFWLLDGTSRNGRMARRLALGAVSSLPVRQAKQNEVRGVYSISTTQRVTVALACAHCLPRASLKAWYSSGFHMS